MYAGEREAVKLCIPINMVNGHARMLELFRDMKKRKDEISMEVVPRDIRIMVKVSERSICDIRFYGFSGAISGNIFLNRFFSVCVYGGRNEFAGHRIDLLANSLSYSIFRKSVKWKPLENSSRKVSLLLFLVWWFGYFSQWKIRELNWFKLNAVFVHTSKLNAKSALKCPARATADRKSINVLRK